MSRKIVSGVLFDEHLSLPTFGMVLSKELGLGFAWPLPKNDAQYTVRAFINRRLGFHVPTRIIATLDREFVYQNRLQEGDRIWVREDTGEVVAINRYPVDKWQKLIFGGEFFLPDVWEVLDHTPRRLMEWQKPNAPEDLVPALFNLFYPTVYGSRTLISGVPGSEKTKLVNGLLKLAPKETKVKLFLLERKGEMPLLKPDPRAPHMPVLPDHVEMWSIPTYDTMSALAMARLVAYAENAFRREALFEDVMVFMDSTTAFAWRINIPNAEVSSGVSMGGALQPSTLNDLSSVMSMAQDPLDYGSLTLFAIHMLVEGDGAKDNQNRTLYMYLAGIANSRVRLQRGDDRRIFEEFSADMGSPESFNRGLEYAIGLQEAKNFWAFYKKVSSGALTNHQRLGIFNALMNQRWTPRQIWKEWQNVTYTAFDEPEEETQPVKKPAQSANGRTQQAAVPAKAGAPQVNMKQKQTPQLAEIKPVSDDEVTAMLAEKWGININQPVVPQTEEVAQ